MKLRCRVIWLHIVSLASVAFLLTGRKLAICPHLSVGYLPNWRANSLGLFCFLQNAVDADEIRRLGKRFRKLDLDKSGALSVEEFMSLPELQQNPLVQRVIDIFDTDGNGEVDFKG